ncbi:MAG: hypothetical protein DMG65_00730 [Candidatus Angelobacter sp. Gp1-AA117]|nr:MAG: hypothetical protein DMG65_00730 [Candidatus Angelobacter sp. Gp1-AA117]
MNTKHELLRRLQQIVSEQLGVQEHEISEKSTWHELGADSLDRLETSRILEEAFDVDIPHQVGEQLNTVGETVDHILSAMESGKDISNIRIETAITNQQWAEVLEIRNEIFTNEYGFSVKPLPAPGKTGVWHFLARDDDHAIGTLSVVDTTEDRQLHQQYRLKFEKSERVARYAQLAILKPYRKCGIFEMLIENAQNTVVRPNEFTVGWLLYPAGQARSCRLTQSLGFNVQMPLLTTEFGSCYALTRRESNLSQIGWTERTSHIVEASVI